MAKKSSGMMFDVIPFLAIPILIYNLIALPLGGAMAAAISQTIIDLPMLSGARLQLDWGDLLLVVANLFLFVEVIKATRTSSPAIMNHMLSMGLFVLCLIEFLLLPGFATSTFFLMTMLVLIDAMAGMVVTIISARRDLDVQGVAG